MKSSSAGRTWGALLAAAVLGAVAGFAAWRLWLPAERAEIPFIKLMPAQPPAPPAELLGVPAPAFTLPAVDGGERSLGDWRGQVVLLNFWATWCAPCREEMPMLVRLRESLAERGFEVVGIAADELDQIRPFVREYGIGFPIVYGGIDVLDLSQRYGNRIGALPYSVLINRKGEIAYLKAGLLQARDIRSRIEPLL